MHELSVFLMCHNRPVEATIAYKSIKNQTLGKSKFNIIISDNSSTCDGIDKNTISGNDTYIRRNPSLDVITHHRKIISEVKSRYFLMFHDDDEMCGNMLEVLYNNIKTKKYSAVGTNAFITYKKRSTKMIKTQKNIIYSNKTDFYHQYISGGNVFPFPGFIYNTEYYSKHDMNENNAGRYSDVPFIASGLRFKPILCLAVPLFTYKYHITNLNSDIFEKSRLLKLMKKEYQGPKKYLNAFRIKLIIQRMKVEDKLRIKILYKLIFYDLSATLLLIKIYTKYLFVRLF